MTCYNNSKICFIMIFDSIADLVEGTGKEPVTSQTELPNPYLSLIL